MSLQLQARVSYLETEVRGLRETVAQLIAIIAEPPEPQKNPNGPRKMCPKCGEQPNYHLHVIHCKGPGLGKKGAGI